MAKRHKDHAAHPVQKDRYRSGAALQVCTREVASRTAKREAHRRCDRRGGHDGVVAAEAAEAGGGMISGRAEAAVANGGIAVLGRRWSRAVSVPAPTARSSRKAAGGYFTSRLRPGRERRQTLQARVGRRIACGVVAAWLATFAAGDTAGRERWIAVGALPLDRSAAEVLGGGRAAAQAGCFARIY